MRVSLPAAWPGRDLTAWLRTFLYALFLFSTFSIAGSEASIFFIYLFALWRWRRGMPTLDTHWLLVPILAFAAITVLSGMLNEYQGIDHAMALRNNWRLLLPFVLAAALFEVDEPRLIRFFFWALVLIALYGVIQYFTGADWLRLPERRNPTVYLTDAAGNVTYHGKGNFTHHLTYGGYLLLWFPLFGFLAMCRDVSLRWRVLYGLGSALMLVGAASSLGRSVWLGIAVALWVGLWRISRWFGIATLLLGLAGAGWLVQEITLSQNSELRRSENPIVRRLATGFDIASNRDRLLMWQTGVSGIRDHFWLGIGYANDQQVMPQYREPLTQEYKHRFFNKASAGVHNLYLQTWLNYGVFGLLAYLGILGGVLFACVRALQIHAASSWSGSVLWGTIAGVCGFMTGSLFENNFRDGEVQTAFLLLMGLALHQLRKISVH